MGTANRLADDLAPSLLHWFLFCVLGFVFQHTLKSYIGEYASAIPICFGTLIYAWKSEFLRPGVRTANSRANRAKGSLEKLKRSVEDTKRMKHMGAGGYERDRIKEKKNNAKFEDNNSEVYEYDADGNKINSSISQGILQRQSKENEEEMKDATTVELKNGRLVNSATSHLTSAMDWHENEIVPPRRRTHQKKLYEGRRKKQRTPKAVEA